MLTNIHTFLTSYGKIGMCVCVCVQSEVHSAQYDCHIFLEMFKS